MFNPSIEQLHWSLFIDWSRENLHNHIIILHDTDIMQIILRRMRLRLLHLNLPLPHHNPTKIITFYNQVSIYIRLNSNTDHFHKGFSLSHYNTILQSQYQHMEGGLFGLSKLQRTYLYASQLIPSLITILFPNLLKILFFTQIFYCAAIYFYVQVLSLERSYYPYISSQLGKLSHQIRKGAQLALSAFLLITIYGIVVMRIGKVALPHLINLGQQSHTFYWACILLSLINPLLQQLYWRLFLPKTLQQQYQKSHLINISYLIFHFTLFSTFLGFWKAQPFVITFYSVGRSMRHIKKKYGIVTAILTHYGITLAGFALLLYLRLFTKVKI